MIYFTSDLHLGHEAMIQMRNRPFRGLAEMNEALIANYNSIVKRNDTVYLLGDITYKLKLPEANQIISRLNGKKYLIRGNHDKKYEPSLFLEMTDFKVVSLDNQIIALMHYPMLEWPHSFYGSLHLHGHQHNTATYNADNRKAGIRRYDVGVDANDYKPVSLDKIKKFFESEEKSDESNSTYKF